jgi:hypothetical protein
MQFKRDSRLVFLIAAFSIFLVINPAISSAADFFQWSSVSSLNNTSSFKTGMSSDGSVIIVGKQYDGVYLSTNSGTLFSKVSSIPNGAYAVAISADGNKMFAANRGNANVYYSVDRGVSWTNNSTAVGSSNNYASCMSGDGSVWMVGMYSGSVYTSTNNGVSWATDSNLGTQTWWSCFINYDGTKRAVLPFAGALRVSTNSGQSWTNSSTTVSDAYCVGASNDFSNIIIGSRSGNNLYRSINGGSTFTYAFSAAANVYGCSVSFDGSRQVAVSLNGPVYISTDGGLGWSAETSPGSLSWYNVTISADGLKVIAVTNGATTAYLGTINLPTTLEYVSGATSRFLINSTYSIVARSNYAGKVTFYVNGKRIPGCISLQTQSLSATCNFKPKVTGVASLSARIVPANGTSPAAGVTLFSALVQRRTTTQ